MAGEGKCFGPASWQLAARTGCADLGTSSASNLAAVLGSLPPVGWGKNTSADVGLRAAAQARPAKPY